MNLAVEKIIKVKKFLNFLSFLYFAIKPDLFDGFGVPVGLDFM